MRILAHIGHPITTLWDGIIHPLTGPDHLLAMVCVGVVAALSASRRVALLAPLGFLGGMVAGGVLGVGGVELPALEVLVAATVVASGILLLLGTDRIGAWLPLAAAAFGVLHGIAHGAEAPAGAVPVAYFAGFVAATAALHASGFVAGRALRVRTAARITTGTVVSGAGILLLTAV